MCLPPLVKIKRPFGIVISLFSVRVKFTIMDPFTSATQDVLTALLRLAASFTISVNQIYTQTKVKQQ